MKENATKKREWVKTAAIIFLSVLLVLTFFSNTIMNYSLPEVAAQYIQSGSITAKIRGNGVVESGDPYVVEVEQVQGRKVSSVAVRVGDTVQKGDVLLYLDEDINPNLDDANTNLENANTNLEEKKEQLKVAQDAYDSRLLKQDITAEIIEKANTGFSVVEYRLQINAAQNAVAEEQKKVDEWQAKLDKINASINLLPDNKADVTQETKAYNEAKAALESLQDSKAQIEANIQILDLKTATPPAYTEGEEPSEEYLQYQQLLADKAAEEAKLTEVELQLVDANLVYERAKQALDNKTAQGDVSADAASLQRQKKIIEENKAAAQKVLDEKEGVHKKLTDNIDLIIELQSKLDAINKAKQDVESARQDVESAKQNVQDVKEEAQAATVTADISGTVTELKFSAGQIIDQKQVAVLQPEGQGYTMSFSVTNEQAKRVSVGDRAELVNSWWYNDMEIILKSIKTDKTDPAKKKVLNFTVNGDVIAGQTLNVSVGQKSADYEMIVPNSAIREDNNGKFILIVEVKNSPLGNRYVATRADVQVVASDDTKSAITGALYGYEFVITTSTHPVEAGQLVRLADN